MRFWADEARAEMWHVSEGPLWNGAGRILPVLSYDRHVGPNPAPVKATETLTATARSRIGCSRMLVPFPLLLDVPVGGSEC